MLSFGCPKWAPFVGNDATTLDCISPSFLDASPAARSDNRFALGRGAFGKTTIEKVNDVAPTDRIT